MVDIAPFIVTDSRSIDTLRRLVPLRRVVPPGFPRMNDQGEPLSLRIPDAFEPVVPRQQLRE
jgi:hypothetical protein